MYWYLEVMKKYAVFSGRARRKEYWMFQLINVVIFVVLFAAFIPPLIAHTQSLLLPLRLLSVFMCFYALAMIIPGLAVSVRRLHDVDLSGWWLLISLVPLGGIVLFVFHVLDSTPGPNRYGPNPKGVTSSAGQYRAYETLAMVQATANATTTQPTGWASQGFCTKCGTGLGPGSRFCMACGKEAS